MDLLEEGVAAMQPLPAQHYDVARVKTTRSNKLFRVALDSNHYSVPAEYASLTLTMKIHPERVCVYHQDKLIYGKEATEWAMNDALQCAAFSCEYVANLLEQRAQPVVTAGGDRRCATPDTPGRFVGDYAR